MKTQVIIFIYLFLSIANVATSQVIFTFSDSAVEARFRHDIGVLASDSFMGRKAGSVGERKAAAYIIEQFLQAGLDPHGTDSGSFLQAFPYETIVFPKKNNWFTFGHKTYIPKNQYGITAFSSNRTIKGLIIDVGRGLVDPANGIDEYKGLDSLQGKIFLMEFPLPKQYPKLDSSELPQMIRKRLALAFSKGASGVILWNTDASGYRKLFDFTSADTMPGVVLFVASEIVRDLRHSKLAEVNISTCVEHLKCEPQNVVGFLNNNATSTIILGGHYDHVGVKRDTLIFNGADDNASGTAMVIELARWLKQHGSQKHNYLFIAFSAEEEGMIGSNYFCKHPLIPWSSISFYFNFDMVGRLGVDGNRITAEGAKTSSYWNTVFRKIPDYGFRVKKLAAASDFSDQSGFKKRGIPIAFITTGIHSDYHTWRDVPQRINYNGMVSLFRFSTDFISLASVSEKIPYTKVRGWKLFWSNLHYFSGQIRFVLNTPWKDLLLIME
jgi:hypothetical protein